LPGWEKFFQLVVFNYVVRSGNTHLKNFSLLRNDSGEYQLLPAYDLRSAVIRKPQGSDTALVLYFGDTNAGFCATHGYAGKENFMKLSKRPGIVEKRAVRILDVFFANNRSGKSWSDYPFCLSV